MFSKTGIRFVVCLMVFVLALTTAYSFTGRNICGKCRWIGTPDATVCADCQNPMNQCLKCMTLNRVDADYCAKCAMPLAEMRVLSSIDPSVRTELKLGESLRAQAELDIKRLEYLLHTDPDNAEKYMYDLGMRHQQINFYSRESAIWLDFLSKFPESSKQNEVKVFASESLRKWSYLMYSQGRYSKAVELLNESVRLNPDNKEARRWLAISSKAARKGDRVIEVPEAKAIAVPERTAVEVPEAKAVVAPETQAVEEPATADAVETKGANY
ncbi:MAG: hypothetical protein A2W80_19320 [Candidatus Riflebacteria bacterium GWC2_50_8]|nr:MAG: hypothetical protein A2W80_19320 [Candidatus Riflebacteria bacterium GWC2_50_8]